MQASRVPPPEPGANRSPPEATPGNDHPPKLSSETQNDQGPITKLALDKLPLEIRVSIMDHLEPVSQMCLGLTNRTLHQTFHHILPSRWVSKSLYTLLTQASVCGKYILNFGWEDWFLRDDPDIVWERNLGELLSGERFWGNLRYCWGCAKYKPEEAFGGFEFEREMVEKHEEKVESMGWDVALTYEKNCARCRTKMIFVLLEGREEVLDGDHPFQDCPSLGLKRLIKTSDLPHNKRLSMIWEEYDAWRGNYEPWKVFFERLDI